MYFENFPLTYYSNDDRDTVQLIENITLRNVIDQEVKDNYSLFDEYDVGDDETPEILAFKAYGDTQLHWIILHFNEILDPRFDWPLTEFQLSRYATGKYANVDAIHHYEDASGNTVDSDYPSATPISNFTYESRLNEEKRRIKILKPAYVDQVITQFKKNIEL